MMIPVVVSRLDPWGLGGDDPWRGSGAKFLSQQGLSKYCTMAGRVSDSDRSESEDQVRGIDK